MDYPNDYLQDIEAQDKFFVKQRFTMLVNQYDISLLGPNGNSPAEPICFVKQKRMQIREEINFFRTENEHTPVLRLKKRNVLEFSGVADVFLSDGTLIGSLRKSFAQSLLRSTWELLSPSGNVLATARERSVGMAVLRRIWSSIPYVGDIPFFIPFHFEILIDSRVVGSYKRPSGLTDRYVMDLSGDMARVIDRRLALALAIALDALQDR